LCAPALNTLQLLADSLSFFKQIGNVLRKRAESLPCWYYYFHWILQSSDVTGKLI
jgi:hypothetical protein